MRKFIMLLLVLLLAFCVPVTAFAAVVKLYRIQVSAVDNHGELGNSRSINGQTYRANTEINLMNAEPLPYEGYYFIGWHIFGDSSILTDAKILVTQNCEYRAKFSETGYQLAFDLQDGSSPSLEMKSFGDEISESTPTRDAFEFGGWYLNPECTGERVTFPYTVKGDVTFYAKWNGTYYEVRFLDEDANPIGEIQQVEYGQYAKAPDDLTKEGYAFKGWSNGAETLSWEEIAERRVTNAVDYAAEFSVNMYAVRFFDEERQQIGETQQVEYGQYAKAPDDLTKEGHTFKGWSNGAETLSGEEIEERRVTDTVEYTAEFSANQYDVRFLDEKNQQIGETQQVEYDQNAQAPDDLTKEGYTFKGWNNGAETLSREEIEERRVTDAVEYTAEFSANQYDVCFFDEERQQIGETQQIEYGQYAKALDDLTKEGHTFKGWSNGAETLSGEEIAERRVTNAVDYAAEFSVNMYAVRFFDEERQQIGETQQTEYGQYAKAPDDLTKEGHTFKGWSNGAETLSWEEIEERRVTDAVEYTAEFSANQYDVCFLDEERQQIGEIQQIEYGQYAKAPDDLTKEGHTFVGWSNGTETLSREEIEERRVTGAVEYTAEFNANQYEVRFLDDEEQQVGETQQVEYGQYAKAPDDLTKVGHTFKGWSNGTETLSGEEIEERRMTKSAEYTAVFETNSYVVTFIADGLENKHVQFNTLITKPDTPIRQGHDFAGWLTDEGNRWNFDTDTMPARNITLTACWDIKKFKVTFYEQDGLTPIGMPQTVNWGCAAVIETAPAIAGHAFDQWILSGSDADETDSLTSVKEDINAAACYIKEEYTVTFIDDQGQIINTHSVSAGDSATAPRAPEKEGYTFIGWSHSFDNVTGDMTVTVQYAVKTCTVRFLDDDGSELSIQTVNWNTAATAPANLQREGYTFIGWDKAFDCVTSDITVTAQYKRTINQDNGDETGGEFQNDKTSGTSHYQNQSSNATKHFHEVENGKVIKLGNEGIPAASINKDVQSRYNGFASLDSRASSYLLDFSNVIITVLCLLTALALGVSIWIVRVRKR